MLQKQGIHRGLGHEGSHLQQLFKVQLVLGSLLRGLGVLRAVVLRLARLEDAVYDIVEEVANVPDGLLQGGLGVHALLGNVAREQLVHGDPEEMRDLHQRLHIRQRLAGFPLGNGLMRNVQRGRQLLLGHVPVLPKGCDGFADCAIVNHASASILYLSILCRSSGTYAS